MAQVIISSANPLIKLVASLNEKNTENLITWHLLKDIKLLMKQ